MNGVLRRPPPRTWITRSSPCPRGGSFSSVSSAARFIDRMRAGRRRRGHGPVRCSGTAPAVCGIAPAGGARWSSRVAARLDDHCTPFTRRSCRRCALSKTPRRTAAICTRSPGANGNHRILCRGPARSVHDLIDSRRTAGGDVESLIAFRRESTPLPCGMPVRAGPCAAAGAPAHAAPVEPLPSQCSPKLIVFRLATYVSNPVATKCTQEGGRTARIDASAYPVRLRGRKIARRGGRNAGS